MQEFLQTLHKQYRTEYYGPWYTREYYSWEYDAKVQECIELANTSDEKQFFLPQAKILQDRADYIRQEWAKQEKAAKPAPQVLTPAIIPQQVTQPIQLQPQSKQPAEYENIAEKNGTASGNKAIQTDNIGLLSTIPYQCATQLDREVAIRLGNTRTLSLASSHGYAGLSTYVRFAKEMEATGQG